MGEVYHPPTPPPPPPPPPAHRRGTVAPVHIYTQSIHGQRARTTQPDSTRKVPRRARPKYAAAPQVIHRRGSARRQVHNGESERSCKPGPGFVPESAEATVVSVRGKLSKKRTGRPGLVETAPAAQLPAAASCRIAPRCSRLFSGPRPRCSRLFSGRAPLLQTSFGPRCSRLFSDRAPLLPTISDRAPLLQTIFGSRPVAPDYFRAHHARAGGMPYWRQREKRCGKTQKGRSVHTRDPCAIKETR
jgi:hypothetical protein